MKDTFGQILKRIRLRSGMTQGDLAGITGLKPTAISHFECDKREPCLRNLKLLQKALNCSANELLGL